MKTESILKINTPVYYVENFCLHCGHTFVFKSNKWNLYVEYERQAWDGEFQLHNLKHITEKVAQAMGWKERHVQREG